MLDGADAIRPWAARRESIGVRNCLVNLGFGRLQFGAFSAGVPEELSEPHDRAARLPFLNVVARAIAEIAHPFGMRPGTVRAAFEQCGASAPACAANGFLGGLENGDYLVCRLLLEKKKVKGAAAGNIGVYGRVVQRNLR